MLGLGAFRRKARTFEYKPRHFDPEAERREERRMELLGDNYTPPAHTGESEYKPGDIVRKTHIRRGIAGKPGRISKQSMAMRIAAILCLLALILWILLT